ncbi:zinc-binding alcohol dehydrogenase family protein [Phanerochaete sordida]|uniref:Zinc-binding alcohol dehydrogenase family protein n=1 Tax=Phanerochaete sordida TaxID=48140 RepID=A0A9P3LBV7_9APHY|nr:zinc-binding alcohol dehydrogenase family protein [Phanerochaete sordida]
MSTQKALFLTKSKGDFAVLEREVDEPGPGEILVEVRAAGLNPVEYQIQKYDFLIKEYPAVLGTDVAGVVVKVGAGVTNVAVGDKTFHQGNFNNRYAAYQQYTIANADIVAKIPSNLTFEQAASLPVALATSAVGLYNPKSGGGLGLTPAWEAGGRGKYAGEPILILGGASAVGQAAIQFARLSGFAPILTTASPHNEAYLKSLGATHVLDRALPLAGLPAAVAALAGAPLKHAYDAVSSRETTRAALSALAPGGGLAYVLPDTLDEGAVTDGKEAVFVYGQANEPHARALAASLYAHITQLLEAGDIKPNNIEVVPGGLAGIPKVLERFAKGVSALKMVAHPQENL